MKLTKINLNFVWNNKEIYNYFTVISLYVLVSAKD